MARAVMSFSCDLEFAQELRRLARQHSASESAFLVELVQAGLRSLQITGDSRKRSGENEREKEPRRA